MSDAINLADPDFEPTDEQLIGLSTRAFAGVRAAREAALARLRSQIEVAREAAFRGLERRRTAPSAGK